MGHTFKNTVILTDAQIKNLPLSFPVVASGKANKILFPTSMTISLDPWFADYTNIDMGSLLVGDWILSGCAPFFSGLSAVFSTTAAFILGGGSAMITEQEYVTTFATNFAPIPPSCLVGQPFALVCTSASGALTGGDARNRLTINTNFYVV